MKNKDLFKENKIAKSIANSGYGIYSNNNFMVLPNISWGLFEQGDSEYTPNNTWSGEIYDGPDAIKNSLVLYPVN